MAHLSNVVLPASSPMHGKQPFRVIIAGGSVSGLTLANALERADIDYVLLERHDVAPSVGASISVLSNTARVLDQLGLWDRVQAATLPLLHREHFDEHGRLFEKTAQLRLVAEKTKKPFLFMERRYFLQTLYDNLRDKKRVRQHTGVSSYVETAHGVQVETDTGELVEGSILVGADGVHSAVRKRMTGAHPGFRTRYKTLYATSRNHFAHDATRPFLPPSTVHNVYYRGFSGVAATGVEGLVFWFLFVREDSAPVYPDEPRYTYADAAALMATYGHHGLGAGYTFGDLWASRVQGGVVAMQEGVLATPWHSGGRVVLVGDATCKATISAGLGGNTCVEAAVRLANELVALVGGGGGGGVGVSASAPPPPTTAQVAARFARYEAQQRPRADWCVAASGLVTRFEAMDTWWLRLLRRVSPWIPDGLKARFFLDFIAKGPTLAFLPTPGARDGEGVEKVVSPR